MRTESLHTRITHLDELQISQGPAVAQAVSRPPLTAGILVRYRVSACAICGAHSGTVPGYSPSRAVIPCQHHSTNAPLSPVSIIPPTLHSPLSLSFHQRPTLPCQYHSTNAPLSPVSIIPPTLHRPTHFHLNTTPVRRTSGRDLVAFKQTVLFRISANIAYKSTSTNFRASGGCQVT